MEALRDLVVRGDTDDAARVLAAAEAALEELSSSYSAQERREQPHLAVGMRLALGCKAVAQARLQQQQQLQDSSALTLFTAAHAAYQRQAHAEALSLLDQHDKLAEKEASAAAGGDSSSSLLRRSQHLRAQVLYREGRFEDSARLFEALRQAVISTRSGRRGDGSDALDVDQEAELATNCVAAFLNAGLLSDANRVVDEARDELEARGEGTSFELVYNAACVAIEAGEWRRARALLSEAEEACRRTLGPEGENLGAAEIADELASIRVQGAFVAQMTGEEKAAVQAFADVLKERPSDRAVAAIAANNLAAVHREHDLFDSLKRIKAAAAAAEDQTLTMRQRSVIKFNHCLVLMHMNKGDECRAIVAELRRSDPNLARSGRLEMVLAAMLLKEKKPEEAEAVLEEFSRGSGGGAADAMLVQLARAQASLNRGDDQAAIAALERVFVSSKTASPVPAVAAALAALHEKRGDLTAAERVLNQHTAQLREAVDAGVTQPGLLLAVLRATAHFFVRHGLHASAASTLERVVELAPSDLASLPQLVIAYSHVDFMKAESFESRLPALASEASAEELSEAEVDELERSRSAASGGAAQDGGSTKDSNEDENDHAAVGARAAGAEDAPVFEERSKKKRKRRVRYPKGYTAETIQTAPKPDPERWLPKRERAAFRKRTARRDRQREIASGSKGAQGSQDKHSVGGVATPEQLAAAQAARAAAHDAEMEAEAKAAAANPQPKRGGAKPKRGGKGGRRRR